MNEVRLYLSICLSAVPSSYLMLCGCCSAVQPSVFNGPEVSMPKDCMHLKATVEHRDTHNQYGFYHVRLRLSRCAL
jgi:hypothetical protein